MSVECQVHVKSQSELDIGGRETCSPFPLDLTGTGIWPGACQY